MDNKIFQITSRLYNFKIWKRRNRVRFFRYLSMRRKDREVTNIIEILQIVEKAKVLHLALFDADYPYIVPLHYGYEYTEGILIFYMHCAKEGHKLDLLNRNPRVCVTASRKRSFGNAGISSLFAESIIRSAFKSGRNVTILPSSVV